MNGNDEACCPEFEPARWDGKTVNWDSRQFIKESIPTFFHIPFPPMIGKKITGMWKLAQDAGATDPDKRECLVLFNDPSAFRSEILISVTKEVPAANNTKVPGDFVSKVYDGGYNAVPRFIKEMDRYLAGIGKKASDYYVHYAYCPKCAKKTGHNYMVLFARV